MTRLTAIVAALIVLLGVFATSSAYAVPLAPAAQAVGELCMQGEPAPAPLLKGQVCAKRHSLGLPCAPEQLALPAALVADVPARTIEPMSMVRAPSRDGPALDRLFRPPRLYAA